MFEIKDIENKIFNGDALAILKTFPDESIDCAVTSPPYWNLRDYSAEGQLGLEGTFVQYVNKLCDIFDEVKRVLKQSGTIWINIGDTYYGSTKVKPDKEVDEDDDTDYNDIPDSEKKMFFRGNRIILPKKSLAMIPARFAIEMINRGWTLRNNIIWHKPSVMPRPVRDRFTIDFENIFFFVKNEKYYFKQQYEKMVTKVSTNASTKGSKYEGENVQVDSKSMSKFAEKVEQGLIEGRIKRTVWKINTSSNTSFHVAPYPEELIMPIIDAGCPEKGIVLDMFMGTGTTALVALKQNKKFVGIDIDERAVCYAKDRIETFLDQSTIFDLM